MEKTNRGAPVHKNMDSDTLPGAAAATDAADPIGLAGEHGISESVQYSTTAGPARQTAPVEMARVISAIDRREVPTSSASRNSGKLNSTRVQRSNRSVGKTPFGYIQRCKCGENQCTSQIYWRHAAMGDPDNVIPNFVWIPAMPKKQVTHLQKRKAKFVEMIYKQIGRDLKEATEGMHLSILHWPRDRRQAMIDSSNDIQLNKGVLTVDEHVELIQQMLDDGSLTESDQFEEGLYWNKPGSIEGAVMELGRMEILYWFDDETLVKKILKSNTSKRPTMPYSDKTLRARLTEDIQIFNKAEADISQGVGGTINVKVPFWVRSTKQDRHKKTGSPGVAVTLNVNDLGSALIPISDDTTIRPAANNRPSPSLRSSTDYPRKRKFKCIEGKDNYLDTRGNPIYYCKLRRRGHWLVSDYLLKEDLERILDFARKHRFADLGTILFILCNFVSKLPDAMHDWKECEELAKRRDTEYEEETALCDRFMRDLVIISASHISGMANKVYHMKDFHRFLWISWDPFDRTMDGVFESRMRIHRRRIRRAALLDVPRENQIEHLSNLSRLHKFLIILLSQQLKDEQTEMLYYRVCEGFTTSESFLGPLRHFSYTKLFRTMNEVFEKEAPGINGERAESFLNFCLVSHLLYNGSFPINYEGLAFHQVKWKKLSIAGIVGGLYNWVPVDSHVERFFQIFAKSDNDVERCVELIRVRTDPTIGRYTNDFIAELGQIFDRGAGGSIDFAVTVLKELLGRDPRYRDIIAEWLSCYETKTGYKILSDLTSGGGLEG